MPDFVLMSGLGCSAPLFGHSLLVLGWVGLCRIQVQIYICFAATKSILSIYSKSPLPNNGLCQFGPLRRSTRVIRFLLKMEDQLLGKLQKHRREMSSCNEDSSTITGLIDSLCVTWHGTSSPSLEGVAPPHYCNSSHSGGENIFILLLLEIWREK